MSTGLEERLHADMERATQDVRVPPGLAVAAYRHRRRRRSVRAVTTAGAVVVALAATLAVVLTSGAFSPAPGGPQVGQQARTVAYVISRVDHALAAPGMTTAPPTPIRLSDAGRGWPGLIRFPARLARAPCPAGVRSTG